jgi:hypothetical protein
LFSYIKPYSKYSGHPFYICTGSVKLPQQTTVARTDQIFNNDYILSLCKNPLLGFDARVFLASGRTYTNGTPKLSATSIPIPIAPVATPAITSGFPNWFSMCLENLEHNFL